MLWYGSRPGIRGNGSIFRQYVVLLCLKVKKTTTYRDLVDELIEMPRIRDALNLGSIPASSTLCKVFDRLEMAVWRIMLNVSLADVPLNGVTCTSSRSDFSSTFPRRIIVRPPGPLLNLLC